MMAAVIVHYQSDALTTRLLQSIERCNAISTIIVVLHSEMIRPRNTRAVFLEQANKGYAAGLNLAVRTLQERRPEIDTVLAMNSDIELDAAAIEHLLEAHLQAKAGATFPTIREGKLLLQGYILGRH